MKSLRLLSSLLFILFGFVAKAQNEALDSINLQLRGLFSPLTHPATNFLYDMAAHVTDSVYFQKRCLIANTTDVWYKVYEEMYHSAYDTTLLLHPDSVFILGNSLPDDTIPIGILHYSFNLLKEDALTTNNYFDFDTVNTILYDKPGRPSPPYWDSTIFIAAPLLGATAIRNPVYRISPQFIFYDAANAGLYGGQQDLLLQINFGDGNGWITFDPTVTTSHAVLYDREGEHFITTRWGVTGGAEISSSIIGTGMETQVAPTQVFEFPGINASFFGGCNSNVNSGKLVVFLSGIDVFDNLTGVPLFNSLARNGGKIYRERISNNAIVQLKNNGYNFLVVDWKNSRIDMRYNALYLVNMLHQLKCNLTDKQQFVIIGESLGGVIGRFGLRYMETEAYQNADGDPFFTQNGDLNNVAYLLANPAILSLPSTWTGCKKANMHNTRLFLTLDSPNQGA